MKNYLLNTHFRSCKVNYMVYVVSNAFSEISISNAFSATQIWFIPPTEHVANFRYRYLY